MNEKEIELFLENGGAEMLYEWAVKRFGEEDGVEKHNDCSAIYTSPPPAAEPLLKEKSLNGLHLNLMPRNHKKLAYGLCSL